MNRRGQIFLIMTILVISFMVGITSILLDVQKADFIEPAPDNESTLIAWETTVESLEDILDVQLAITTQANDGGPAVISVDIDQRIDRLEAYLDQLVPSNNIEEVVGAEVTLGPDGSVVTHSISATFDITLSSTSTTISQTVEMVVSYTVESTSTTITVSRSENNQILYLPECTFSTGTITDNGNGSYDHSGIGSGNPVNVTTPSQVIVEVTIP